jgi:hypothetical protein
MKLALNMDKYFHFQLWNYNIRGLCYEFHRNICKTCVNLQSKTEIGPFSQFLENIINVGDDERETFSYFVEMYILCDKEGFLIADEYVSKDPILNIVLKCFFTQRAYCNIEFGLYALAVHSSTYCANTSKCMGERVSISIRIGTFGSSLCNTHTHFEQLTVFTNKLQNPFGNF